MKPQARKVLKYLKRRPKSGATNLELANECGLRFGARIAELRAEGYSIETVSVRRAPGLYRYYLR